MEETESVSHPQLSYLALISGLLLACFLPNNLCFLGSLLLQWNQVVSYFHPTWMPCRRWSHGGFHLMSWFPCQSPFTLILTQNGASLRTVSSSDQKLQLPVPCQDALPHQLAQAPSSLFIRPAWTKLLYTYCFLFCPSKTHQHVLIAMAIVASSQVQSQAWEQVADGSLRKGGKLQLPGII